MKGKEVEVEEVPADLRPYSASITFERSMEIAEERRRATIKFIREMEELERSLNRLDRATIDPNAPKV